MSIKEITFSEKVKMEFIKEIPGKTCCRKALAYGILFDAEVSGNTISIDTPHSEIAEFCCALFKRQFAKDALVSVVSKAGKKYYRVSFEAKAMAPKIAALSGDTADFLEYVGIKCETCKQSFMRGIFISRGTLTVSPGNNHLEYRIVHVERAQHLVSLLTALKIAPKTVKRGKAIGIYYKSADKIEDSLKLLHSVSAIYKVVNLGIERAFSSDANRGANCEAFNIARAVESAQRQLHAIEFIKRSGAYESLSDELKAIIDLRLENHEATLSELAAMLDPPLTKSALNNRIGKIMRLAETISKK